MGLFTKFEDKTLIEDGVLYQLGKKDIKNGVYEVPIGVNGFGNWAFHKTVKKHVSISGHLPIEGLKAVVCHDNVEDAPNLSYSKVERVRLSNKTKAIRACSFYNTSRLEEMDIPDSVQRIGESAFEGSEIKRVKLPKGLTYVDNSVFFKCSRLQECAIPETVQWIGMKAFMRTGLKKVTIPKNVEYIGQIAFADCENLEEVEFCGLMPESGGDDVFHDCKNLKTVKYRGFNISLPKMRQENGEMELRPNQAMEVAPFVDYAVRNKKKLPKLATIIRDTNQKEIEDFYNNAEAFTGLVGEYISKWSEDIELSRASDEEILSAYHKACVVTGLFSGDGKKSVAFMREVLSQLNPDALVKEFEKYDTHQFGYDEKFAQVYMNCCNLKEDNRGIKTVRIADSDFAGWGLYNNKREPQRDQFLNKTYTELRGSQASENA